MPKHISRKKPITPKSRITSMLRRLWLYSRERQERLKIDKRQCWNCKSKVKPEVHHIDPVKMDRIINVIREELLVGPEKLATYCRECHREEHMKLIPLDKSIKNCNIFFAEPIKPKIEAVTQKTHHKKNQRIYVLIPARAGSRRIKNKNIRTLGNHPLLAYSIITAQACGIPVFVSTDSSEYAAISKDYGAEVVMRPPEIADDQSTDLDVIQHFLSVHDCDLVIYLRPTTPLRTPDRVMDAVKIMSVPGYDSLRSVEEMSESAFKCFKIRANILHPLTSNDLTDKPNQLLQPTYHPNGYVDIVRGEIVKRGALWGVGRYAFLTPKTVEIDTEDDFEYAEYLINYKKRGWEFGKIENRQVVRLD